MSDVVGGNLYSKKIIAELLNLSERRVEQLAQKKIIPKAERGKYDLGPTVKAYVMYLQQKLTGGGEAIDVSEFKDRLLKAKALEQEAKARLREIMKLEREGKVIDRAEVVEQWAARCVELKSALLSIPMRVGFRFPDPETRLIVEEEMEMAIHEILETYSRNGIGKMDDGGASGAGTAGENKCE
ncbi:hypothetical protein [Cloacibacillus evryensis]|uniref:hypothetical protein n=1 Tax=Cloacibacillus evryensis TaxID=508460 RepID=UPI00068801AE|nr:hypothetical protein [Cloacibacillus evryensis]MEA5034019.1 hypothetical protein [Cloacibacillus evryensis]